ncbi:MAG TPA: type II toxin-antitoxin system VapC family toxin [Thermoanaerobaculia bacterium]|nr:type II toxin-antitoxin system VapC family toxin [Thermoanaerobaculia bacterium]
MSLHPAWILDASALLAYLQDEPGAALVEEALLAGATISAINWAETLSKLAEQGQEPGAVAERLENRGILPFALQVHPVDEPLARHIAVLRPVTRQLGLSLGDRACLALSLHLEKGILTADRHWGKLDFPFEITMIR